MRHCFRRAALLLLLGAPVRSLVAQGTTTATGATTTAAPAADPACTYMSCAIRIESSFWNGTRFVRGPEGTPVSGVGSFFSRESLPLFAGHDSASANWRSYAHSSRVATVLTIGGAVLTGVAYSGDSRNEGLALAGLGVFAVSIPFDISAARGLSRAIWWYNADVAAGR